MRRRNALGLLLAFEPLSGCATVLGTAISPIAGPVDAVRLAFEQDYGAKALWLIPLEIILSPLAGLFTGLGADLRFVETGEYDPPPMHEVFEPWRHLPGH